MSKLIFTLTISILAAVFVTGCSGWNEMAKGITKKNISIEGTFVEEEITPYDATTNTPMKIKNLVGTGSYDSTVVGLPVGYIVPDSFESKDDQTSSVFNSAAITRKKVIRFTASNAEQAKYMIDKLIELEKLKSKSDSSGDGSKTSTGN